MRQGQLLLAVILVAVFAVVFFGLLRWEEGRRAGRLRRWASRHGWRLISDGAGPGVPEWASGEDWREPKIAVVGQHGGYEVAVSWGETLSYSGLDAVTAVALRLPRPVTAAAASRHCPRGQVLTVHGDRLMIQRNGWLRPGGILPAVGDLAAIAGTLTAASAVHAS